MTTTIPPITAAAIAYPAAHRVWLAIRRAALATWPDDLTEAQQHELAAITAALDTLSPVDNKTPAS